MDTRTLVDRVYQTLREQILQGDYAPGQKLNLAQLARDLGVSNTPIRESMARLEQIGLIELVPYCGPRIKHLNTAQVIDIYDVRIALEALALQLVAQKNAPDIFKGMLEALEMQERAYNGDDPRAVVDADRAFHDALIQASGSSVLLELLPNLSDRTQLLLELISPPIEGIDKARVLSWVEGHKRVYELLMEGNQVAAEKELRSELTRGKQRLVEQMMKREESQVVL